MMTHPVTLYFRHPALKSDLEMIPEELLEGLFEALMQGARLAVGFAKINVRVDTGSLRDSIRVERGGRGLRWRQIRIRAGGYVTNPKSKRKVDYAVYAA